MVARITITLKSGILDPEGQTVKRALEGLGFSGVKSVGVGKYIELRFNRVSAKRAKELTDKACKRLLANPVIEDYAFEIVNE